MASRRRSPSATLRVTDGAGGLRNVHDHRFDEHAWTYRCEVPAGQAEDWMAHLGAVESDRGWSGSGLTQLEAAETSGSITVHLSAGAESPTLEIAWTKCRGGDLQVAARSGSVSPPSPSVLTEFFEEIAARIRNDTRERAYRRGWLEYDGLPWTGELWLTPDLRLGPPSRLPDTAIGRQIVLIDTEIDGIGHQGITARFERLVRELCLVLSPIVGVHLQDRRQLRWAWVPEIEGSRFTDCRLRSIGYVELTTSDAIPPIGAAAPLALTDVVRPGLHAWGISAGDHSVQVPSDIVELWATFSALEVPLAGQYLRACNAYSIARSMFPNQRTAYLAFLVVACEALKPVGKAFETANAYDVIATLLDVGTANRLKEMRLAPQKIRSDHVHRGELVASELGSILLRDPFGDPSIDETLTALARITRQCLIEWLRRGGLQALTWLPRPKAAASNRLVAGPKRGRSK